MTPETFIKKGLDSIIDVDLYDPRAFSSLKSQSDLLFVFQNGTRPRADGLRSYVGVSETQIISGVGNTDIVVKKIGVRQGKFGEVILFELHKKINK